MLTILILSCIQYISEKDTYAGQPPGNANFVTFTLEHVDHNSRKKS